MAKIVKVSADEATEADDYIIGTHLDDKIDGLGGNDKIKARAGDDFIRGGDGDDTIYGQFGDDVIIGDRGNDKIFGDGGDDTNIWNNGDGTDRFYGGKGFDTQVVNGSPDLGDEFTIAALGDKVQFDRVNFGQFGITMKEVEELQVNGLGGDDTMTGSEGLSDLIKLKLSGGDGNDQMTGGDGDDKIYGDAGDDLTVGFRGNDKIYGGDGNDTNIWNNGDGTDKFFGGEGFDTQIVNGSDGAGDEFTIAASGDKVQFDRVNFGQFGITMKDVEALVVNGLGGDDTMTGSEGLSDLIKLKMSGGDGNDQMTGGDGDDKLYGDAGDDLTVGFRGNDKIYGGDGNDTNIWNNGDGTDKFFGGEGHDTQIVNGSDGAGDEFTIAASGDKVQFDRVNFGQFGITMKDVEKLEVNGLGGDDTIEAGDGLSHLIKLKLSGGDGNDVLTGGDGGDWIDGGTGNDIMTGNAGADVFRFEEGHDVITDFEDGVDLIQLSGYDSYWAFDPAISQVGKDTVIEAEGGSLTLEDTKAWTIDESDFLFV